MTDQRSQRARRLISNRVRRVHRRADFVRRRDDIATVCARGLIELYWPFKVTPPPLPPPIASDATLTFVPCQIVSPFMREKDELDVKISYRNHGHAKRVRTCLAHHESGMDCLADGRVSCIRNVETILRRQVYGSFPLIAYESSLRCTLKG